MLVNHCDKCFLKMSCIITTFKTCIRLMGKMNGVFYLSSIYEVIIIIIVIIIIKPVIVIFM